MAEDGSCDPARDRWVAFWAATMLSGRVPPRDVGRLCHDSAEDLAGGVDPSARLSSASLGDSFSFVGEDDE